MQTKGDYMIKVQAIQSFNFGSMDKIKNLKRFKVEQPNFIFKNDIFECDKDMYEYLSGKNENGVVVVKLIEYKPSKN